MVEDYIGILPLLKEIEDVTDINGCFLLRLTDQSIVESTIPLKIHEDILWEIVVLRETFQQFSTGVDHGELGEIILEGEKGFIFLFNIPPHFLLIARAGRDIRLALVKLGLIDIIKRLSARLKELGVEILAAPVKAYTPVGGVEAAAGASFKAQATPAVEQTRPVTPPKASEPVPRPASMLAQVSKPETPKKLAPRPGPGVAKTPASKAASKSAPAPAPSTPAAKSTSTAGKPAPVKPTPAGPPSATIKEPGAATAREVTLTPVKAEKTAVPEVSIDASTFHEKVAHLEGKPKTMVKKGLGQVFNDLKQSLAGFTGEAFAQLLDAIKDLILENVGTSLALFDISRCVREMKNERAPIDPRDIPGLQERIDNWTQRIVK